MARQQIRLAHSPDSDDAFMFYALATDKIDTGNYEFVHELEDIETLNRAAREGRYEVTAISIHAFAYLHERYALLNSGASLGDGYGPLVVSARALSPDRLKTLTVAVPGEWTSAFLALKLYAPEVLHQVLPFDQILPALERGEVEAGVIIHEGQLVYRNHGLHKIVDLGAWWKRTTHLPLPLGGNAVRRDLGADTIRALSELLRESIRYALDHREQALNYAAQFGRHLDAEQTDHFVSMYVNERTLDYGEEGRRAVQLFLDRGFEAGLVPHRVQVEFV